MRKTIFTCLLVASMVLTVAMANGFMPTGEQATRALTGSGAAPIIVSADTTITGSFFALFAENSAVTYSATMADSTQLSSKTIPALPNPVRRPQCFA